MIENDPGLPENTTAAATVTRSQGSRTSNVKEPVTIPEAVPDGPLGAKRDRANLFCSTAALEPEPEERAIARCESTELERRVLAHERILQALIAHMTETEPKFLVRLTDTFCAPMQMARPEHDYTDTDSFAEAFIRTVVRLGNKPAGSSPEPVRDRASTSVTPSSDAGSRVPATAPAFFQVIRANGVSRVTRDGSFHGDYFKDGRAWDSVEVAHSIDKLPNLLKGR